MAKYRVRCTLLDSHPRDSIVTEKDIPNADIPRLLEIGAISPADDPEASAEPAKPAKVEPKK